MEIANVCKYCNSDSLRIEPKGTQTGLYCNNCGKWQKWVGKKELANYKRDTKTDNRIENNIRNAVIDEVIDKVQYAAAQGYSLGELLKLLIDMKR